MSEHKDKNPIKPTGLRAPTDADRSPEFKQGRSELISSVDEWLKGLATMRDNGEQLAGYSIADEDVIRRIKLGSTAVGTDLVATESAKGISLSGDGVATALRLQAVIPSEGGGWQQVEVVGPDPLARAVYGDYSSDLGQSQVVMFSLHDTHPGNDGGESYYTYTIEGNGSIYVKWYDAVKGGHTGRPVEDIQLAVEAFAHVRQVFESGVQ